MRPGNRGLGYRDHCTQVALKPAAARQRILVRIVKRDVPGIVRHAAPSVRITLVSRQTASGSDSGKAIVGDSTTGPQTIILPGCRATRSPVQPAMAVCPPLP